MGTAVIIPFTCTGCGLFTHACPITSRRSKSNRCILTGGHGTSNDRQAVTLSITAHLATVAPWCVSVCVTDCSIPNYFFGMA
jgi:Fe-S-cluster-containing dehydrogenase component